MHSSSSSLYFLLADDVINSDDFISDDVIIGERLLEWVLVVGVAWDVLVVVVVVTECLEEDDREGSCGNGRPGNEDGGEERERK